MRLQARKGLQVHDVVGDTGGGGTVGDEDDGLVAGEMGVDVVEETFFGLDIQGGGGLVKDHDSSTVQQGPGYGNPLALTFGKACAALSADRVKTVGNTQHELSSRQL